MAFRPDMTMWRGHIYRGEISRQKRNGVMPSITFSRIVRRGIIFVNQKSLNRHLLAPSNVGALPRLREILRLQNVVQILS